MIREGDGPSPTLDPSGVRRTLREAGLRPRHALSQNFLADPDILQAILDEARVVPGRRVLEIGPGLGILTGGLLAAGAEVTAVELDSGLAARLRETRRAEIAGATSAQPTSNQREASDAAEAVSTAGEAAFTPGGRLRVVEGDILDQVITDLVRPPYDVVANLPYHITSPVLHRLLGAPPRPERLVLMVQREVAERIAAPPGRMSYLSVFVQYHAAVRIGLIVPRQAFEPAPAVDSAVIVLEPFASTERLEPDVEDELWRLVQAAFRERRKMLRNVLVRQLPLPASVVEGALAKAGIAGERRPQTLAVAEWIELLAALGPLPGDARGQKAVRSPTSEPQPPSNRSGGQPEPEPDGDGS